MLPEDTEGEPVPFTALRPPGEDRCSTPSTAGELSLLCLREVEEESKGAGKKAETENVSYLYSSIISFQCCC